MLLLYALTLFTSATLLFLVQLIIGKMITPLLGGTPEVWNTCMVFFQALLLAGYAYAHATTAWLGPRKQSYLHLAILLLPFLFFPITINKGLILSGESGHPIPTVLAVLFLAVGVPFFAVSTSAPLLQKWFSSTSHPSASDPYFLYGASNVGSMLVLFSYPVLIEPYLRLADQRLVWMVGYGMLVVCIAGCAAFMWYSQPAEPTGELGKKADADPQTGSTAVSGQMATGQPGQGRKRGSNKDKVTTEPAPAPAPEPVLGRTLSGDVTWWRRIRWILLAAIPSSMLLGATTYVTTDIAPIPLLWIPPLGLYLLTFIIVFSKTPERIMGKITDWIEPVIPKSISKYFLEGHKMFILAMPLLVLLLVFMMQSDIKPPKVAYTVALHLVTLFVVAMVCHGELARDRPSTKYLTEFFMWMSFGGVVGGMFNGLLAPVLFNGLWEYPLAMVVACLLLPPLTDEKEAETGWGMYTDLGLAGLFLIASGILIWFRLKDQDLHLETLKTAPWGWHVAVLVLGVAAAGVYIFRRREERLNRALDFILPACLGVLLVGMVWGLYSEPILKRIASVNEMIGWDRGDPEAEYLRLMLTYGVPAILCYTFVERSIRFGLGVGTLLLAGSFCGLLDRSLVYQERGFFGVLRVEQAVSRTAIYHDDEDQQWHRARFQKLVHGTTLHGQQFTAPAWRRSEPLTYYHRTGPIGQVFAAYNENPPGLGLLAGPFAGSYGWQESTPNVAVIGLGTGTMATYARPGQNLVFYDIDPLVKRISYDNDRYFSFVTDARKRGVNVDLRLNDARLAIEREVAVRAASGKSAAEKEAERYGLMVIDAFSSDAIPIHLITLEALKLYLEVLREDGILAFHISNRYLDLRPVLANLVEQLNREKVPLVGLHESDGQDEVGKAASTWVVIARKPEYLARLLTAEKWEPLRQDMTQRMLGLTCLPLYTLDGSFRSLCLMTCHVLERRQLERDPTTGKIGFGEYKLEAPWQPLKPRPEVGVWTDDYAPILRVFLW
jgi:SAM-dependent methyltransferase